MSLDTGIFSGSQKLPVRRSQTSKSFSSGMTFQLIALTGSVWLSTYSSYSFGTVSTYLLDLESDVISGSQHTPKHDPLSAGVPHFRARMLVKYLRLYPR